MDETHVTGSTLDDRISFFRPTPRPVTSLPFGLRSLGRYRLDPMMVDDRPARGFVQLYWCVTGEVGFGTAGGPVTINAGDVFVYPSTAPHRVSTRLPATDYWWFTLDGPLADVTTAAFGLVPPWPRRAGLPPDRLFSRLAKLLPDPCPANERAAAALGWELLSMAASGASDQVLPADDVVERLRRLLIDQAQDPGLSVVRLADTLGSDRSVLTRRFTRAVGMAPKPFLQSIRLSRAMSLLHGSTAPVAEIARLCGFSDPGYFARAFREHTGMTPERFRRG